MIFVSFFHVICKISNSNKGTAKYLEQASCTELTLLIHYFNLGQQVPSFYKSKYIQNISEIFLPGGHVHLAT